MQRQRNRAFPALKSLPETRVLTKRRARLFRPTGFNQPMENDMNKYFTSAVLMLIAGQAKAHSHPAADAFTHAVEHLLLSAQSWLPYLAGLFIAAPLAALLALLRGRRSAK